MSTIDEIVRFTLYCLRICKNNRIYNCAYSLVLSLDISDPIFLVVTNWMDSKLDDYNFC